MWAVHTRRQNSQLNTLVCGGLAHTRPAITGRLFFERPIERVCTVGIGWILLTSATGGFSDYIKFAYCSSAKGLQYSSVVRSKASD